MLASSVRMKEGDILNYLDTLIVARCFDSFYMYHQQNWYIYILHCVDPSAPSFRKWLQFCGAGAYISSFFEAGYDLGFIAKHGLTEVDLDCIGIPRKMRGVWRKLEGLHKIEEFIDKEEAESEAEDTDESDPEDSSDADSD